MRASAARFGVAVSTAFRWRHRFLRAVEKTPKKLRGIVEADETFVLRSRKGARKLDRKPRRRGGKATERGSSREQVPVLVAADRGGGHASAAPPTVSADALKKALGPVIETDIVPVSNANRAYRPCAAALGVRHEALDMSAGERARDAAFHIQDRQQPSRSAEGLPARLSRHRDKVSRQLSAVVPPRRTRRTRVAKGFV